MACKTETEIISDIEYSVTQWPAEKAMLMKFKLLKIVGPALAAMIGDDGDEGFKEIFSSATPEELVSLMKDVIIGTSREGVRMTSNSINEYFSGDNLFDVYRVFAFILNVNYSNFLKGQSVERFLAKLKENL